MEKVHDEGPFYHGTKAELKIGDYLRAGFVSNYDSRVTMNHIYFTALKDGAGFAAKSLLEKLRCHMSIWWSQQVLMKMIPMSPTKNSRVIPHVPIALLLH